MSLNWEGHNVNLHLQTYTSFFSIHVVPIRLVRLAECSVMTEECIVALSQGRKWLFKMQRMRYFPRESALIDV